MAAFLVAAAPFATGLANPRRLLVLPNGRLLVTEQSAGYLTLLRQRRPRPRHLATLLSRSKMKIQPR